MVKYCQNCGAPIKNPVAKFCEKCGEAVSESDKGSICPHCGEDIGDNQSLFCKNCGESLEEEDRFPRRSSKRPARQPMRSGTTELILGLLGGIIGFFAAIAAIFFGSLGSAFGVESASQVIVGGFGAIIFSILGIVGAAIVKSKPKIAGYLMVISAIAGLICISVFFLLSFVLLLLGGILAVIHNREIYFFSSDDERFSSQKPKKTNHILIGMGIGILIFFILLLVIGIAATSQSKNSTPTLSVTEIKNQAQNIPYSNLMRNSDTYQNSLVYFRGKIVQVQQISGDNYVLRIATKNQTYLGYSDDVIWVDYSGKRLLEGDIVDVWGKFVGLKTYIAILGNSITTPEIDAQAIDLVEAE